MVHSFCTEFAERYSIESAIIIEHLYWWLHKNACESDMIKEDRVWCYFSAKGMAKYIPYMNSQKIRRELKKLEELEVVKVGNFNKQPTNQTLWYCFTDKFLSELNDANYDVSDFSKMKNGIFKNEKCNNSVINNTLNEDNKKENKKLSNDNENVDFSFDLFWKKYHKGSKQTAKDQWDKLKDKEKERVLNTIDDYLTYCRRSNRPLKDCSSYLCKKFFNDDWNIVPDCYTIKESDDDRHRNFKEWMCKDFPDLIYHRNPLTFEQAIELFDMYNIGDVKDAMRKLCSIDIHQYFNIKSGIEKVLESDEIDEES